MLSLAMLPFRNHLSVATAALMLVLPVAAAAAVGGYLAGVIGMVAGFVAFDVVFVPPFDTIQIGTAENWLALVVYAVVVWIVARVVAHLRASQIEARRHATATRRIFELSEALIRDRPFEEFLANVTTTFLDAFELRSVVLMLPVGRMLDIVSTAGEDLTEAELAEVVPAAGVLGRPSPVHLASGTIVVVPLSTSAGPLGLLALVGSSRESFDSGLLQTYANQVALALERAQLREHAIRSELLEQVDRWRDALIGAVSHDLRTPLAVIKAAVSDLLSEDVVLSAPERTELLAFIDGQADRLSRLVVNLLDMTRIRAGALKPRLEPVSVAELLSGALATLPREIGARIRSRVDDAALVGLADRVLITQVLANLLDNADRHASDGSPIEVDAMRAEGAIAVSVTDHGPGVSAGDRERIFDMFNRVSGAGRAGLGLTIAKAFIDAHGGWIEVSNAPGGGARFTFTIAEAP
jgi:two-component system sensor histidine kinase KdpD